MRDIRYTSRGPKTEKTQLPVFSRPSIVHRLSTQYPTPPPAQGAHLFMTPVMQKPRRSAWRWLGYVILCLSILLPSGYYWKMKLMQAGVAGYTALFEAREQFKRNDIAGAHQSMQKAEVHFATGTKLLLGSEHLLPFLERLPGTTTLTTGIALIEMGQHVTAGGQALLTLFGQAQNQLQNATKPPTLLDLIALGESLLRQSSDEFQKALPLLVYVHSDILPEDKREAFMHAATLLPILGHTLTLSVEHVDLLQELLGKNGPRAYLFLFENNHELRPTGGFIGSYAFLEMNQGVLRRFFVDGIFNPDGQLKENIVPPTPIQKVSTGWSLHDSNWFPDFPTSAKKAMFFYEKTGGPTTDGVIALTPEVLKRLLMILGPIALPDYGVVVDQDNFIPLIQEEVEVKYNKEDNTPKKILGDLTRVMLERLIATPEQATWLRLADTLNNLLNERHILLYARNEQAQALILASGWSGAVLPTPYDYVLVVHTNVNGFKTDGVMSDALNHAISIQSDGSVIDTLTIKRTHHGGQTPYGWWNKVNANYMRVYVPLGSELLSAEGMTRESLLAPVDYTALHFRRDDDVEREEKAIRIDESSGTRIGEEFGKTVFGNWVYASPGESVTVTYRYRLPFRVMLDDTHPVSTPFSILYQKQAGESGQILQTQVDYPSTLKPIWQSPENLVPYGRALKLDTPLDHDTFVGVVFGPNT